MICRYGKFMYATLFTSASFIIGIQIGLNKWGNEIVKEINYTHLSSEFTKNIKK